MTCTPRFIIPGQPLHITQRGNDRAVTFVSDEDFQVYKRLLRSCAKRAGCEIHAYVLMTNHVHLLLTPRNPESAARMMQGVGGAYVPYFNERQGRTGTLWEGRYWSTVIHSERYFLTCSAYVDLNPIRAGLTREPGAYRWSSYRFNALGLPDPLVTPHPLYNELDSAPGKRQAMYRTLCGTDAVDAGAQAIRDATLSGRPLGTAAWQAGIEAALKRRVSRRPHGGDRRSRAFLERSP